MLLLRIAAPYYGIDPSMMANTSRPSRWEDLVHCRQVVCITVLAQACGRRVSSAIFFPPLEIDGRCSRWRSMNTCPPLVRGMGAARVTPSILRARRSRGIDDTMLVLAGATRRDDAPNRRKAMAGADSIDVPLKAYALRLATDRRAGRRGSERQALRYSLSTLALSDAASPAGGRSKARRR